MAQIMDDFTLKLAKMIKNRPQCLDNTSMLKGLLTDTFPGEKLKIKLLLEAYATGVVTELSKPGNPNVNALNRAMNTMMGEYDYGRSQKQAAWAVNTWAAAMGKSVNVGRHPTTVERVSTSEEVNGFSWKGFLGGLAQGVLEERLGGKVDSNNQPYDGYDAYDSSPASTNGNDLKQDLCEIFEMTVGFMPHNVWYQLNDRWDGDSRIVPLTNLSQVKKNAILNKTCRSRYTDDDLVFVLVNQDFSKSLALTTNSICIGSSDSKSEHPYASLNFHMDPGGKLVVQGPAPYYNGLGIPWTFELPGLVQYLQYAHNYTGKQ